VNFAQARLPLAVFHRARCKGASFAQAGLEDADFSYADLTDADLVDARFLRTRLHRAIQQGTRFSRRGGIIENDPDLHRAQSWSDAR